MENCRVREETNDYDRLQSRIDHSADIIDEQRADFVISLMAGNCEFAPNSEWSQSIADAVDHLTKAQFAELKLFNGNEFDEFLVEYKAGKYNAFKKMLRPAVEILADYLFYDAPVEQ